ncbi:ankyrin repeat domain-containing protein [Candidatus Tisiphia endosymbiont of Beris chalybata]|uniref:ankyrin repeat domain-containing protein n=1 Tax=Candidatus Tisiphia endosymbiont of Beris chalybata TaxID=3066262 RepID=UPI00312C9B43
MIELDKLLNEIINKKKESVQDKIKKIKELENTPNIGEILFTVIESKLQNIITDDNKDKGLHSTIDLIDALEKENIFLKHQLKTLANTKTQNVKTKEVKTILNVAIKTVTKTEPIHLIEWGAELEIFDKQGRSYLHTIASDIKNSGILSAVAEKIIKNAPELLDHPENTWDKTIIEVETPTMKRGELRTPTHIAAYQGNKEIFHIFLKNGANITSTDQKGYAPLHCMLATQNMRIDIFNKYLNHNGPVALLTADGENMITVIKSSAKRGKYKIDANFYSTVEQILGVAYANGLKLEIKELNDFLNDINTKGIITREEFLKEMQLVLQEEFNKSGDSRLC